MSNMNNDTLNDLVVDALSKIAFVFVDPVDSDEAEELPQPTAFTSIRYEGTSTGTVALAASEGFLRELTSSLLGLEPEDIDPATEGLDALRELANILGGSVVHEIGGVEQQITLALPEASPQLPAGALDSGSLTCSFDSEGERLDVIWMTNAARAAA